MTSADETYSVVSVCKGRCIEEAVELSLDDATLIARNMNEVACSYTVYMVRKDSQCLYSVD